MRILIHRGSSEIGGTCIELSAKNTKILLDIGAPLNPENQKFDVNCITKKQSDPKD